MSTDYIRINLKHQFKAEIVLMSFFMSFWFKLEKMLKILQICMLIIMFLAKIVIDKIFYHL